MKTTQRNFAGKLKQLEKQNNKQKETIDGKESEIKRVERQIEILVGNRSSDALAKEERETLALKQKAESRKGLLAEKEATEQTWMSTMKISQVISLPN